MRCVFLVSDDLDPLIQAFRLTHDPLARVVPPHVTVVFPFDDNLSDIALLEHIRSIRMPGAISATLAEPVVDTGYIYLPLTHGREAVHQLHDDLYTGPLRDHLLDIPYLPHLTIARVSGDEGSDDKGATILQEATRQSFKESFTLNAVVVERIVPNGNSILLDKLPLTAQAP